MHYNVARVQYNNLFDTLNCINISPVFLHFPLDLHTLRQTHIRHVPSMIVAKMSTRKPITPASMKEMVVPLYSAVSDEVAVVASVLAAVVVSVVAALFIEDESNSKNCKRLCLVDPY